MAHVLALRFSALGDVAMTVPVVSSFAAQYPQHRITVVSRRAFAPLFEGLPANVRFYGVDLADYRGLRGLSALYRELSALSCDAVADWHNVLRTRYLRLRFRLAGCSVAVIDKGRADKRRLTRPRHKVMRPLPTSFERYADVLAALGCPVRLSYRPRRPEATAAVRALLGGEETTAPLRRIGIAPFAKHRGKIYPLEALEQVVAALSARGDAALYLFGGGSDEKACCERLAGRYPRVTSLVGRLRMDEELALMAALDVMLTMDSGNMHLASLVGTRVVSIWGATHPYAGFAGWAQRPDDRVQTDLPCRPCSVYGKTPCRRGDYACLATIRPQTVVEHVVRALGETPSQPDTQQQNTKTEKPS